MKRNYFVVMFGAAALLLMAGCSVGPRYHRPTATVPQSYQELPPPGWKQAQPNSAIDRGKWWEIYNDPALNALEEQVSISNQNVLQAEAFYRQARANVGIARSAFFPTVGVTPSVSTAQTPSRSGASFTTGGAVTSSSGRVTDYMLPLNVSYEADVWGSIRHSLRASIANAQVSAANLANARLLYQAQLAQFYFELHGVDSDIELLERTLTAYQQYLQLTKDRFEVGVASGADVAQAQTQLASTQATLIDLGVQREQLQHAIAILIGKPPAGFTIPRTVLKSTPPAIPVGLPSDLLERRPDIANTERQVAVANEQIGIAKAAFFPALNFSVSAGFETAASIGQLLTWPSRFWSVGPQLAETLFQGGRRRSQLAAEQAAYDATVAGYRQTVLTAFQQVEDELAALRILEQEAAAEDEAVKAAEQSLAISTEQYKAGTTDYLQVITSQTAALVSERAAVDILTRRMTASVVLIEALGGGWNASQLPMMSSSTHP